MHVGAVDVPVARLGREEGDSSKKALCLALSNETELLWPLAWISLDMNLKFCCHHLAEDAMMASMANMSIKWDHLMAASGGVGGSISSQAPPLVMMSLLSGLGGTIAGGVPANDTISGLLPIMPSSWPQYANDTWNTSHNDTAKEAESNKYSLAQIVLIAIVAGFLSIVTVVGNLMVMISFKMDKQLQTISNYFLLSLAVADLTIGLNSMPLFTVYLLMDSWPLGPVVCDTWLALDYLASNASVLNLLIISFDRYFSVTRPLTYRARRTTRRAIFMISCAWVISLILWPPWIYSWPYIEGQRMVPSDKCFIQFLETNLYVTFGTAVAAFYIPVTVMCVLYWQIWRETEKRQKDLTNLQAGNKDNSKRSTSSDDAAVIVADDGPNRRSRSDSTAASAILAVTLPNTGSGVPCASTVSAISCTTVTATTVFSQGEGIPGASALGILSAAAAGTDEDDLPVETTYVPTSMCIETQRYLRVSGQGRQSAYRRPHLVNLIWTWILGHCRFDRDHDYVDTGEDSTSDGAGHGGSPGNTTPASVETPVQSTMSRCTSLTLKQDPFVSLTAVPSTATKYTGSSGVTAPSNGTERMSRAETMIPPIDRSAVGNGSRKPHTRSQSSDSVYTILIRLPTDSSMDGDQPTIKMISEDCNQDHSTGTGGYHQQHNYQQLRQQHQMASSRPTRSTSGDFNLGTGQGSNPGVSTVTPSPLRRVSQVPNAMKLPLTTKLVPKQPVSTGKAGKKKKKKTQERKQDRKAAKTLSAILLAFIITWTPYNVLVLIRTVWSCTDDCLPPELWNFSYYLCYINSTVNPLCYALCNAAFRRTYVRILTCKWHTKRRHHNRGYYS